MPSYTIRSFKGIAPRLKAASSGVSTFAKVARNVDLFSEVCAPAKGDLVVKTGCSGPDLSWHQGTLVEGVESPVNLYAGDKETLVFKKNGAWVKRIGLTDASLGIPRPSIPSLSSIAMDRPIGMTVSKLTGAPSMVPGVYTYYATWATDISGDYVESAPSAPVSSPSYIDTSLGEKYMRVSRPTNLPTQATAWNLYRSSDGDTPKKLATLTKATLVYDDVVGSQFLGDAIDTTKNDNYEFLYVVTWDRTINEVVNESGPSLPSRIISGTIGTKIQRPTGAPGGASGWNLYRISIGREPTADFELVARISMTTLSYDDYSTNEVLGDAIPTSYISALGFAVQAGPPTVIFDGMSGPHHGMLIGWKGATLYYSETGKPDYWSEFYKLEAKSEIVNCVSTGSSLVVITRKGLQHVTGREPLVLTISDSISGYAGTERRAVAKGTNGIFFLGNEGICQVANGLQTSLISDQFFDQAYFDSIDKATASMEIYKNKLYLTHSGGTLILDLLRNSYTELAQGYDALTVDRENGRVIALDGTEAKHLGGADDPLSMLYRTGEIVLSDPTHKRFMSMQFYGTGELNVKLYVDNNLASERLMDMDGMSRKRTLSVPRRYAGRSLQAEWSGVGTITEISLEVQIAPIEVKGT